MEKILKITDSGFKTEHGQFDGYLITTDLQEIKVGISSFQSCCESFGILITEDNISDFIGAFLIEIYVTDTLLNNWSIEQLEYLDEGGVMFVNFKTTKGLFQIVAYNAHNGYYGHEAVLISKQISKEEIL